MVNNYNVTRCWIAVRLPQLPLDALEVSRQDDIVVTQKQQIVCVSSSLLTKGIKPYMPLTTAQLLAEFQQYKRRPEQEFNRLTELANQLYAFTPYLETHVPHEHKDAGFTLEVSRSLKLFNGLSCLYQKIYISLKHANGHFGIGHTPSAAWLLSFISDTTAPSQNQAFDREVILEKLSLQPVRALTLLPQSTLSLKALSAEVDALEKTGFKTLGDILKQIQKHSFASIRKRWSTRFCELMSELFDIDQSHAQSKIESTPKTNDSISNNKSPPLPSPSLFKKPLIIFEPESFFYNSMEFDYPINTSEQLHQPMAMLLQKLSDYLQQHQLQCQAVEWRLFDIYHDCETLNIYSSQPQQKWQLLYELSQIQLESNSLPFEVDGIELHCRNTQKFTADNQTLAFSSHAHSTDNEAMGKQQLQDDFARLTAKLQARIGNEAIFKIDYNDSHIPELSNKKIDVYGASTTTVTTSIGARPSWIFSQPQPIEYKSESLFWRGTLALLQGPERIEGNWWDKPTARDYFLAQRDDGLRVWVFYDLLQNKWLVQGVFS
ncbi:Y-family DNA polymerase [Teredinibacter waterburyi]|uniref:Y-family DNA polymerase n=1 Tax=Teredinibacter waterburyi TaxID=1500538 RepID=UPI00165F7330|nr:DNA polymerase Y family protein [Teredinibacter waterburyi]